MSEPLHGAIADDLRGRIVHGDLSVGDPVPSESSLCRQWGSSRGPVRQALATLRAEGLIEGGRGKPPVVAATTLAQPFDTLLSYSAWVESIGRTPGQRTIEFAPHPADAETASRLELAEGDPVVTQLRLRLLDGEPAMLERTSWIERVGRLLVDFDTDSGSEWSRLRSRGEHMASARHVIDAVAADPVDALHLGVGLGTPLLRQRRVTRNAEGEVLEYDEDRYLPEVVSFSLENTSDVRTPFARNAMPAPHAAAAAAAAAAPRTGGS
ncbi:GntR family transcriptional regulator [Frondihabitans sp. PAMC 28766]|uniref:GntR family transcriptional regulator n=1 Tax=Frondihabitans sp. PAMC 28766 TaxID=1795630 RepID=UPI0009EAF15D|nr:GntR family transcriptional regulator [Frondihabitans sp. PAMC 28766]